MKQGHKRTSSSLPLKVLAAAAALALLYGFTHPMRSEMAAHEKAPLLAGAPAPHSPDANPGAPVGAGAIAAGVATLAASRRK